MATRKNTPWSNEEVQTFLCLVAEERIQRELDGATRNEKVYQEISELLSTHGYNRTFQQCREKLKKLKSDYRAVKDHNGRSGSNRKSWKWYEQMDGIYGHRPASNGREGGLDSATSLLESLMEDGRRKRKREQEHLTVLREMQTSDVEQLELNRAQRERHLQMALDDAAHARELEAALRREEMATMSSFNQAFLGTLSQLVQALNRRDAVPPPLD
ncbi:zinc finger protein with KRAB and SCAN domains 2-like [Rhinichthys klamathensis goyatoka]|uniref:zinc finger protein with KRAB and SCAN domains 2-like n=1 Tax=Rhinichthys klamathensis goyatoka TaxID=3034132 RepID=UPI0024B4F922|nr:zinc finger protein with KRAB and SCAN domains 2-like [Rhinichthys klamathensis goyatoka]